MAVDTNVTLQSANGDSNTLISMAVADVANGLAVAQQPLAAGALVLGGSLTVGGVYTGTGARRLALVSANAGDTTQLVTIVGTDRNGIAQTEVMALNGVTIVTSALDYLTVTSATISAATLGNITLGTSAKASGAWIMIDRFRNNPTSIACVGILVSGAVNFTLEHTYDNPNTPAAAGTFQVPVEFPVNTNNPGALNAGDASPPTAFADATIAAKAATTDGSMGLPWAAYRWTVNSGTGVFKGQARVAAMASGMR